MGKVEVFYTDSRTVDDRLDPVMALYQRRATKFKHKTKPLSTLLSIKPQYGANEAGTPRKTIDEPRYIRITDIDKNGQLIDELGKTAKNIESKYILNNNDLLFARSGATVGKTYIHKSDKVDYSCFYAGYLIRFIINSKAVNSDYIFYYTQLDIYSEWVEATQRAAGQPNINAEEYKSLEIPVPPKNIQNQVIGIMDTAYKVKKQKEEKAQELLDGIDDYLLDELGIKLPEQKENTIQNRIFYMSTSEIMSRFDTNYYSVVYQHNQKYVDSGRYDTIELRGVVTDLKNGVEMREYVNIGYRYLRVSDIDGNGINDNNPKYVDTDNIPINIKLNENCILMSRSGTLGLVCWVSENELDIIISSHIFKVELNTSMVVPEYLIHYLRSSSGQMSITRENNGGVVPEINQTALKSILFPIPPLTKQTEIANYITATRNKAKQLHEEATKQFEDAKQQVENIILGR